MHESIMHQLACIHDKSALIITFICHETKDIFVYVDSIVRGGLPQASKFIQNWKRSESQNQSNSLPHHDPSLTPPSKYKGMSSWRKQRIKERMNMQGCGCLMDTDLGYINFHFDCIHRSTTSKTCWEPWMESDAGLLLVLWACLIL